MDHKTQVEEMNVKWSARETFRSLDLTPTCQPVMVDGLTRGKDIWDRVQAIGPNNTSGAWSDPATVMAA